jgi:6-phosphogluconolactonase
MTQVQRRAVRGMAAVTLMVLTTALTGCGAFFVCQKASCTDNGGTTGAAGNIGYVSNNVSSVTEINGYTLAKSTLAAATGSPYSLGLTPTAMVMSHDNAYLYVASTVTAATGQSQIFGFSVGTGGALTLLNGITPLASQSTVAAMDVSPDNNWLVVTTANGLSSGANATTITAYPRVTATGLLTAATPLTYGPATSSIISSLKVAPSGQFISVALGLGGVATFPFNTSTGLISNGTITTFSPSTVGAYDVAIDANNLLYMAVTGGIFVFPVSTAGVVNATPVTSGGIATASGGPFSLALDGTSYVYASASNTSTNLIYGFSNKAGVLTALSPATIAAPSSTTKLAVDSTGAYLLAAGYDSSAGLQMFSITSGSGSLTSLGSVPTGTSLLVPTALALSH